MKNDSPNEATYSPPADAALYDAFMAQVRARGVTSAALIEAARFWSKLSRSDIPGEPFLPPRILYYFSIHLRIHPQPAFVFDISDTIEQKMQSIRCYESQFITGKSQDYPTTIDDIRDRARYWGWSIGAKYGEPFVSRESIRMTTFRDALV